MLSDTSTADPVHVEHKVYARDPETGQQFTVPWKTRAGLVICSICEGRAKWGWVYRVGQIKLITCNKRRCWPPAPPWIRGFHILESKKESLPSKARPHKQTPLRRTVGVTTFTNWLAEHRHVIGTIGDLAREVCDDKDWPKRENNPSVLYDYLLRQDACDDALSIFKQAYVDYHRKSLVHITKESLDEESELSFEEEFIQICEAHDLVEQTKTVKSKLTRVRRNQWNSKREDKVLAMIDRGIPYVCSVDGCNESTDLTVDHKTAISRGGTDEIENLRFMCRSHNSKKGTYNST